MAWRNRPEVLINGKCEVVSAAHTDCQIGPVPDAGVAFDRTRLAENAAMPRHDCTSEYPHPLKCANKIAANKFRSADTKQGAGRSMRGAAGTLQQQTILHLGLFSNGKS